MNPWPAWLRLGLVLPLLGVNAFVLKRVLVQFAPFPGLFLTAALIAFLLDLPCRWLMGRGLSRISAVSLVMLLTVGLLGLAAVELLWQDGVEAIAPTLVTCGMCPLRRALEVLRQARRQHQPGRCRLLGAHLEGPFLAEARRGAHPMEHLAAPSLEALDQRIGGFESEIALVTLAPELEGAAAVIQRLRQLGIAVALGHSAAKAEQAGQAFDLGVEMITHAFNAMPGLHHRAPGPLGEACRRGGIALGLIADGVHVDPTMAVLLQRLAPEQTVLVSDALAPYGLADGEHRWDERVLLVQNGTCRLEDGTLAGVTLPQLEGVRRLARWSCEPSAAIWSATIAPRRVIGSAESIDEALIDQPLTNQLRWTKADDELHWSCAA